MTAVAGFVFDDVDGDGDPGVGEPGVGNVAVTVTSGSGAVTTMLTAPDGRFRSGALTPGTVTVTVARARGHADHERQRRPAGSAAGQSRGAGPGGRPWRRFGQWCRVRRHGRQRRQGHG